MGKVEFTHTDKVWFPKDRITKGDILSYYEKMASKILPFLKGRPIVMERFPDGIGKDGFFQKNVPEHFPKWIPSVKVKRESKGKGELVVGSTKDVLLYLVNFGCVTPHIWLSSKRSLEKPDRLIFDVDPPKGKVAEAREVARLLKEVLSKEFSLTPFLMTTGSRGFHVVVPIKQTVLFEGVRGFAKEVAEMVVEMDPSLSTTGVRKSARKGRVYIDVLRNAYAQHGVAPYAVRALPGAPIAMPVSWSRLNSIEPQSFSVKNCRGGGWSGFEKSAKSIASLCG